MQSFFTNAFLKLVTVIYTKLWQFKWKESYINENFKYILIISILNKINMCYDIYENLVSIKKQKYTHT